MAMLRPSGKFEKIAKKVMKSKGITVRKSKSNEKTKVSGPYLQH